MINRIKDNVNSNNFKKSIFISSIILIILFLMQLFTPKVLELETRWIALSLMPIILSLLYSGKLNKLKGFGLEIDVVTSVVDFSNDDKLDLITVDKLPSDYYYINHTSFLRESEQNLLRNQTGINSDLYDIRVKLYSYYNGAIDRIDRVEYYLHSSYPNPIRTSRDSSNNFILKELAHGEYVLSAKVYMSGIDVPFITERYINLWKTGPII